MLESAPRDSAQAYWDPPAQTMSPDRRRALQDERLRDMIERVFSEPVPFFRNKLETAGVSGPGDIRGVDDLDRIPLTIKQELRDSERDVPPVGDYRFTDLHRCVRLGTSTGTTGTPTHMLWTKRDLLVEYEAAARNWWRMGIRPGMICTHAHPAYLYGGGALLSGAYEYFGALNIWVPPPDTDELAEQGLRMWARIPPDIPFMGFSLGRFFEVAAKLGLKHEDVSLRIPELPPGPPSIATAGAECFAFMAGFCKERDGGHIAEDFAAVQAVDPATGRSVPDGEWGDLVVTTFGRDNCMIRYDLEEACRLERSVCACGETTARGWWGGRYKDLIHTQGRRLQMFDIEAVLGDLPEVSKPTLEYVVVRPRDEAAPLALRVERGSNGAEEGAVGSSVADRLQQRLGVRAQVTVMERGTLPRFGYKAIRVVDE
jgi:phenylacetate-CoA ligase